VALPKAPRRQCDNCVSPAAPKRHHAASRNHLAQALPLEGNEHSQPPHHHRHSRAQGPTTNWISFSWRCNQSTNWTAKFHSSQGPGLVPVVARDLISAWRQAVQIGTIDQEECQAVRAMITRFDWCTPDRDSSTTLFWWGSTPLTRKRRSH